MVLMAERKPKKPAKYPSRDKVRYVHIPLALWERLKAIGDTQERSVAFITRKAIEKYLEEQQPSATKNPRHDE